MSDGTCGQKAGGRTNMFCVLPAGHRLAHLYRRRVQLPPKPKLVPTGQPGPLKPK